jgi:hypothetical protein
MARKPKAVIIDHDETPSITSWDQVKDVNQASEHSMQIMTAYGDGMSYDRTRIVGEARFYMAQSAEAMLEAGKRLVILKEHEAHGEFEGILRDQIGIPERTAQRMMQSAIKYLSPKLQSKAPALALLGKTKLLELMTEDDDQLASLAEGGTVAGMTLDDIDRMSARELRTALRKAREDVEDTQRVIADKNKKIDSQAKQINRIKKMPPDELAAQLRTEITAMQSTIEHDMRVNLFNGIMELVNQDTAHMDFVKTQIDLLENAVQFLRENLGAEWE